MKKILIISLGIILLNSCKGKLEIKIAEPPKEIICNIQTEVDGPLKDNIEVENEKIHIKLVSKINEFSSGYEFEIDTKINFIKEIDVRQGTGYNSYGPTLELQFLDKSSKILEVGKVYLTTKPNDLANYLKNSNRSEVISFAGSWLNTADIDMDSDGGLSASKKFIDEISKTAMIRVVSDIIEEEIEEESSSSSASGDCDQFLADYEEYVTEYIEIAKELKDNPSDTELIQAMANLSSKAAKFASNIESCENDKTIALKIAKLQMRLAEAAY